MPIYGEVGHAWTRPRAAPSRRARPPALIGAYPSGSVANDHLRPIRMPALLQAKCARAAAARHRPAARELSAAQQLGIDVQQARQRQADDVLVVPRDAPYQRRAGSLDRVAA